jgi:hypothetical protein
LRFAQEKPQPKKIGGKGGGEAQKDAPQVLS